MGRRGSETGKRWRQAGQVMSFPAAVGGAAGPGILAGGWGAGVAMGLWPAATGRGAGPGAWA